MWCLLCFTLHLVVQIESADLAGVTSNYLDTVPSKSVDLGNLSTKELNSTFEDLVFPSNATPEVPPPYLNTTPKVLVPGLGSVRGSLSYTYRFNRTVFNFRAVPYAQPPSGPRRFQGPEASGPWSGVLDGTRQGRACPQKDVQEEEGGDPEDCLNLNLFTTTLDPAARHPVMVYLHGGAFKRGSSADFTPDMLLDRDVVLVVPQYRLGALGFLSLQNAAVPGNAALLDIVAALRWVRDHVTAFGGDPARVTVFGLSSGSALASLLLAVPSAAGLFHGVICQSGTFMAPPFLEPDPVPHALEIAALMGCEDVTQLERCLANATVDRLVAAATTYQDMNVDRGGDGRRGLCPVVQRAGREIALSENPVVMLESGRTNHVPVMAGTTLHDGISYYFRYHNSFVQPSGLLRDTKFLQSGMMKYILHLSGMSDVDPEIREAMSAKYLPGAEEGNIRKMLPGIVDLFGQLWMKGPSHLLLAENCRYNDSFYYSFAFTPFSNASHAGDPIPHGAELRFLFPMADLSSPLEKEISWRLVQLWTNFATYGSPTPDAHPVPGVPKWPPYQQGDYPYLLMEGNFTVRQNISEEFDVAARSGIDLSPYFRLY